MNKWIAGTTVAAAVLSMTVASAQTYPKTSDQQPTTKSAPATRSGQARSPNRSAANSSQRIIVTGCVMQGTSGSQTATARRANANAGGWILSNAALSNEAGNQTSSIDNSSASRSGSPSNEGTSAGNRNGTAGVGVAGSTSTAIGTSGTNTTAAGNIDTEAHGAGTLGATDQAGSTVGAGATAGATSGTHNEPQTTGTSGTASTSAASSYQLSGITNPNEYSGKRVEVTGMLVNTRVNASARRNSNASSGANAMPMLRVTSVRVLGDTCQ